MQTDLFSNPLPSLDIATMSLNTINFAACGNSDPLAGPSGA